MATAVWAHRGASAYAPENTLEAFDLALKMGADGIELDVHMTKDNKLVVIHDETVNRTSNGNGFIKDMTCKELKQLDFSNGIEQYKNVRIPTLAEVFGFVRGTNLYMNIELKCDKIVYYGIWDEIVRLAAQMGVSDRIIYSSFNHYVLMELRKVNPDAKIGLLYGCALYDPWEYAKYLGANAIHPHYAVVLQAPGLIEGCKASGVAIHPWTVDSIDTMRKLMSMGVDAIITDKPDEAVKIRRNL